MTNIITITKNEIGNAELNSVNAREIHSYLEVKTPFSMWIQRAISKYDFKENIDYVCFHKNVKAGNNAISKEYIVTLDMAKELAMLENNAKGKETRKYFISCEKKLKENVLESTMIQILENQKAQQEQLTVLTSAVIELTTFLKLQNTQSVVNDICQQPQQINITLELKSDKDLTSENKLSLNEISILKILAEKRDILDRKIVGENSYYRLTLPLLQEYFPVKVSERTLQRHVNSLREKKLIEVVNKFDGNYIKLNSSALEILGEQR